MKLALLLLSVAALVPSGLSGALMDSMNAMNQLMGEEGHFNRNFYSSLAQCLDQMDKPRLRQAADAQWQGMLDYAASKGNPGVDDWHDCGTMNWFEKNCTVQEYGNMSIYEPCNYASNVAYYHTVTEICGRKQWSLSNKHVSAMAKVFTILAQGSAFMHGSNTINGGAADVRINDLFTFVVYQAAVSNLKAANRSVIHDLGYRERSKSGSQWTDTFLDMYIQVPVKEWGTLLNDADFPSLRYGMCGFFATTMTLFMPNEMVDQVLDTLLTVFSDIPEDLKTFCLGNFLPEVRASTAHIQLSESERARLVGDTLSTAIKLIYSFLWQEEALVQSPILLKPLANQLGYAFLPVVNNLATKLSSFHYSNPNLQSGKGIYPGEAWCNPRIPHAKWHLETGIGLVDFVFLADEINQIIVKHSL